MSPHANCEAASAWGAFGLTLLRGQEGQGSRGGTKHCFYQNTPGGNVALRFERCRCHTAPRGRRGRISGKLSAASAPVASWDVGGMVFLTVKRKKNHSCARYTRNRDFYFHCDMRCVRSGELHSEDQKIISAWGALGFKLMQEAGGAKTLKNPGQRSERYWVHIAARGRRGRDPGRFRTAAGAP
eukprot:1152216-Pelagomonas_calceolata.AAC.4